MDSADPRRIAALLVKMMRDEVSTEYQALTDVPAYSLKDILQIGLSIVQAKRQAAALLAPGAFPISAEILAALNCLPFDPTPLEALFARDLEASSEDPREAEATLLHAVVPKRRMAEVMAEVRKKLRDQARVLGEEDERTMFARWSALQPAIAALLELQKSHPRTGMMDGLRFLAS